MRTVPVDASDELLLAAVRDWVQLVAEHDFVAAVDFLYQPASIEPGLPLEP